MKIPTSVLAHVFILHRHPGPVTQCGGREVAVLERRNMNMFVIQKQLVFSVCA